MRVVVVSNAQEQREQIRIQTLALGLECGVEDCVPFSGLHARLAHARPALVLAELGSDPRTMLPVLEKAISQANAPVLVVGPDRGSEHPEHVVEVIRCGAREYIHQDHFHEEMQVALHKLNQAGFVNYRQGRTVLVTAASPGSGVTTVASNLAFALAAKHPEQVLLCELGTSIPELALALDLTPPHSLAELLRDWDRMDSSMIRQTLTAHEDGLPVLACTPETLEPLTVDPRVMRQTILLLRTLFDHTVLDVGHSIYPAALEAMRLANVVVVLVRLDIPSLRLTRRFLHELADAEIPSEKIQLVVNRLGQRRQVDWRRVQPTLGMEAGVFLPDDPGSVNKYLNQGRPLLQVAPWSRLTRRLNELARRVDGPVETVRQASGPNAGFLSMARVGGQVAG